MLFNRFDIYGKRITTFDLFKGTIKNALNHHFDVPVEHNSCSSLSSSQRLSALILAVTFYCAITFTNYFIVTFSKSLILSDIIMSVVNLVMVCRA